MDHPFWVFAVQDIPVQRSNKRYSADMEGDKKHGNKDDHVAFSCFLQPANEDLCHHNAEENGQQSRIPEEFCVPF